MSILMAMLHHALYYCGFFKSLWNLDLKWSNAAIAGRGLVGDEFHMPDVRDSCISLEY